MLPTEGSSMNIQRYGIASLFSDCKTGSCLLFQDYAIQCFGIIIRDPVKSERTMLIELWPRLEVETLPMYPVSPEKHVEVVVFPDALLVPSKFLDDVHIWEQTAHLRAGNLVTTADGAFLCVEHKPTSASPTGSLEWINIESGNIDNPKAPGTLHSKWSVQAQPDGAGIQTIVLMTFDARRGHST